MSRTADQDKLTPGQEAALKKLHEQSKAKHGDRFLTLTKDDRAAKYILERRIAEQGATPVTPGEIEAHARREEKYGCADWTQFDDVARGWPDLTKRPAKRYSAELWDALERFVQLSNSAAEDFQNRYPTFLPVWFYSLACGNDAEPNLKTGLLAWQAWRALLREAWHSGFHPEYVAQLVNIPTTPPGNTMFEVQAVCDAQRAVLAMTLESWRARFCPKCGSPFVARKAAHKYWPKECFTKQRREKQRAAKRNRARKRRTKLQKDRRRTKR